MKRLTILFAVGAICAGVMSLKAADVEVSVGSVNVEYVGGGVTLGQLVFADVRSVSRGYLVRVGDDVAVVTPDVDRLGRAALRIRSFVGLGVQSDLGRKDRTVTNFTGTGPHLSGLPLEAESSATAIFRREGKLGAPKATWRGTFVMKLIPLPQPPIDGVVIPTPTPVDPSLRPYLGHMSETLTVKATRSGRLTAAASKAQNMGEAVAALRQALFAGRLGTDSEVRWGVE